MSPMMDPTFAQTTYCLDELHLKYHKALSERQRIPVTEWNLSNTSLTRFGLKRWTGDVFPALRPRKKWHAENRNVRLDDFVIVESPKAVRGNWNVGRVVDVYPGQDSKVRNVRLKTRTGEYQRPITKIVVIQTLPPPPPCKHRGI